MFDISKLSQFAKEIGSNILNIENITNAAIQVSDGPAVSVKPSSIIQKALDSELNSKSELDAKKIMATALLVAKKTGVLPASVPASVDAIGAASMADESISVMKVAAMVGTERMDSSKAIDVLADKATVRTIAISDKLVEKGVDFAVNKLSVAIVAAYPPAAPLAVCIKMLQPIVEEKTKQFVRKGIIKISNVAKSFAKKAVEKIKTSLTETVKAPSKRLLSILGI